MDEQGGGFTLMECVMAIAVIAVMAGLALPNLRGHELRMARLDAVQALTRVQTEQEQYRALNGLYAGELNALRGVMPRSQQGRYALGLEVTGPAAYRAVATAIGAQMQDRGCGAITLTVNEGYASAGPTPACWNR